MTAPNARGGSRLDRITPIKVVNPEFQELNDGYLLEEMTRA